MLHSGPRARADFQRVAAHMGYRNEVRYALTPSSVAKNGDLIKTTGDDTFALTAKGERLVKERFENEYPQLEPLFKAALDALGLDTVLLLQAHAVPAPHAALKAEAAAALKTLTLAHRKRAFELFQDMDVDEDDDAAVAAAHRAAKRRAAEEAPVPEEATALRAALTAVTVCVCTRTKAYILCVQRALTARARRVCRRRRRRCRRRARLSRPRWPSTERAPERFTARF